MMLLSFSPKFQNRGSAQTVMSWCQLQTTGLFFNYFTYSTATTLLDHYNKIHVNVYHFNNVVMCMWNRKNICFFTTFLLHSKYYKISRTYCQLFGFMWYGKPLPSQFKMVQNSISHTCALYNHFIYSDWFVIVWNHAAFLPSLWTDKLLLTENLLHGDWLGHILRFNDKTKQNTIKGLRDTHFPLHGFIMEAIFDISMSWWLLARM